MRADTEIRRDLIRGWRDEAVELWRELYREPPEPDPEDDPDDDDWRQWWMAREATQVEIAVSAMDIELAREVDDICWRNMAEVRILDRRGKVDEIGEILDRAVSIREPELRAKAVNGVCQGILTPAFARDLGLLGHALSIPGSSTEQQNAVFHLVSMLGDRELWRWVDPPRSDYQWYMVADSTGDPEVCRHALDLGLLDRNYLMIRYLVETIAATGNLGLNEWAFRRLFSHPVGEERGTCFALLGRGPLGQWAIEFAMATARSIEHSCDSFKDNVLDRTFRSGRLCGYARDNVLAEIAVVTGDASLADQMVDEFTPVLTRAQIGIENGNPEPIRALDSYYDRASGLAALGWRLRDERLLLEACEQFDGEEKDRKYLYCLGSLIDVATNPPARPFPERRVPVRTRPGRTEQLTLPLDV